MAVILGGKKLRHSLIAVSICGLLLLSAQSMNISVGKTQPESQEIRIMSSNENGRVILNYKFAGSSGADSSSNVATTRLVDPQTGQPVPQAVVTELFARFEERQQHQQSETATTTTTKSVNLRVRDQPLAPVFAPAPEPAPAPAPAAPVEDAPPLSDAYASNLAALQQQRHSEPIVEDPVAAFIRQQAESREARFELQRHLSMDLQQQQLQQPAPAVAVAVAPPPEDIEVDGELDDPSAPWPRHWTQPKTYSAPVCSVPDLSEEKAIEASFGVNVEGNCRPRLQCRKLTPLGVRVCTTNAFLEDNNKRLRILGVANQHSISPSWKNALAWSTLPRRPPLSTEYLLYNQFVCRVDGVEYPATAVPGSLLAFFLCDIPARNWTDGEIVELDQAGGGLALKVSVCVPEKILPDDNDEIAACLPPLHGAFEPKQVREWLAYVKQLGVTKVFAYDRYARYGKMLHGPISDGFVDLVHFEPYLQSYACALDNTFDQQLAINHCLHRSRSHNYKFTTFFDVDEYIVDPAQPQASPSTLRRSLSEAYADPQKMGLVLDMVAIGGARQTNNDASLTVEQYARRPIPVPLPDSNRKAIAVTSRVLQMEVHYIVHNDWRPYGRFRSLQLSPQQLVLPNPVSVLRFNHFHYSVIGRELAQFRGVGRAWWFNLRDDSAAWAREPMIKQLAAWSSANA